VRQSGQITVTMTNFYQLNYLPCNIESFCVALSLTLPQVACPVYAFVPKTTANLTLYVSEDGVQNVVCVLFCRNKLRTHFTLSRLLTTLLLDSQNFISRPLTFRSILN